MSSSAVRDVAVPLSELQGRELATDLLRACGVEAAAAEQTARALVLADVWGVHSHGLMRLPFYLERLTAGGCNPKAELRKVTDTGPLLTYDGEDGLGQWQVWRAAETAAERARQYGISAVAVGRSSHCGALGVYTLPAIENDLVALVFSNGPAVIPPWGGSAAVTSTSPLACGIPAKPRAAIIDMATSMVARGVIQAHAQRNEPIPEGWALTADGQSTTDPHAALAGMLAPMGGAKGFALAFMVEALTGGLIGPSLSTEVADMFAAGDAHKPQEISHVVMALDPAMFDITSDPSRLDRLAQSVTDAGGRVPGAARLLPHEIDDSMELAIGDGVRRQLNEWSEKLLVSSPRE